MERSGSLTDVPGIHVGHVTDVTGRTGVTVVVLPVGNVASGEVRGGAPGTREFELLAPERAVRSVDAVVLSGGSAFGLAACDGVMRWCEQHGRGVSAPAGRVPIVVGAVIFDLLTGDAKARPDAEAGYDAAESAHGGPVQTGQLGGGTGAMVGHAFGAPRPGGIGSATQRAGGLIVSALLVVNAYGDRADATRPLNDANWPAVTAGSLHTTIGVVATNARLAQSGHHGIARAIEPSHTLADGDALVAACCGTVEAPLEQVRALGARAVTTAALSVLSWNPDEDDRLSLGVN
jgi:L-aminopeptidase/D-esterase-like protein